MAPTTTPSLAAFLLLAGTCCLACSPPMGDVPELTKAESAHHAHSIYIGKILQTYPDPRFDYGSGSEAYTATMKVYCIYKGPQTQGLVNITEVGVVHGMCFSSNLEIGQEYIVFVNSENRIADVEIPNTAGNRHNVSLACGLDLKYPQGLSSDDLSHKCPQPASEDKCVPKPTQASMTLDTHGHDHNDTHDHAHDHEHHHEHHDHDHEGHEDHDHEHDHDHEGHDHEGHDDHDHDHDHDHEGHKEHHHEHHDHEHEGHEDHDHEHDLEGHDHGDHDHEDHEHEDHEHEHEHHDHEGHVEHGDHDHHDHEGHKDEGHETHGHEHHDHQEHGDHEGHDHPEDRGPHDHNDDPKPGHHEDPETHSEHGGGSAAIFPGFSIFISVVLSFIL